MAGKSGRNVKYAVQEDPAFIKRFKEKIGYKEDPGIEEKVLLLSYAPSALVQTEALQRDLDSLDWWSNTWGMKFNTKMSNYVHRQWEVTSYVFVQLTWSHIVQCSDIRKKAKYLVVLVLSCTLDPQPCKLHP